MKNKDMFLIDDSETGETEPNWFDSIEEVIANILTSVGFIIALVLIAVNVDAAPYTDNIKTQNEVTLSDIHQGSLLFKSTTGGRYTIAPMLKTDVSMKVSGMVVRTKLVQQFKNDSKEWLEGVYVFPLPETAAVDHMKLRIGERTIEGQIKERTEAKKIYETAKRQGKKAALIEQERPNMFTNSVANIGPGEVVSVEIEYQQVLKYDNGVFKIRFPTTITPRYIPKISAMKDDNINISKSTGWSFESSKVADASRITPPQSSNIQNPINIHIELNAGFSVNEITSTYHKIHSVMHLEGQYTISLVNENVPSDRDFELVWRPELGNVPQAALFTEPSKHENYHLVMLMPPEESESNNQALARDVTYIIDTSGSMYGESMRQAKSALQLAIQRLRTIDKFNIIEFDSDTNVLFTESRLASVKNVFIARNFVDRLKADGGTEMRSALQAALNADNDGEYINQIIFLTDGSVGNEAELFNLIKNQLGTNRLFTVAIGSSPNSHFMTKAAKYGRGTYTYIGKISEVKQKMSELFSKLEKPVMQNLKIHWPKGIVAEIWPKRLPDLYAGEPLIFTARVNKNTTNAGLEKLLITGNRNQKAWQTEIALDTNQENAGIAVLWARSKIESLMDGIREFRNNSSSDVVKELKEKIIKLALSHHLVSKYTSLVAVDVTPTRPVFEGLKVTAVANSIPRGSVNNKVVQGQYAQSATYGQLHLTIGIMLILLCLFLLLRQRIVLGDLKSKWRIKDLRAAL